MVNNKTLKIKYLTIIIFVFSFLLFRPYFLQNQGMMYSGDDENYFAHTTSMVFFEFPDYESEYWSGSTGSYPSHSIGPAIMSLPFTMIFSLVDRVTDSGIVQERNRENNETSWTAFGFIVSTIVYYYFGCILLFLALCYFFNERVSFLAVVFMAIFQYLPLYAFRRPIFSHIYEFFLQCVLVFILIKNYKEDFLKNSFKVAVITGLILALSFLVRYENVFIAAVWPLAIAYSVYRLENRKRLWQKISVIYGILLFFVLLAGMFALFYGYGFRIAGSGVNFFSLESPVFYLKRIFHIFFWIDWGLIFTASLLMISLVYLFFIKNRIATTIGILLIPVMFKLYIAVIWRTQGGWYGYRYLVFVLIPLLTIPLAFLIKRILTSKRYRYWMVLLGIISVFPVISMLAFEGNTNLTLSPVIQYFGKSGWGNNYYQLEVWRTLFLRPVEFLIAVLKGGFLYIAYLFFLIFDVKQLLPAQILNQYPVFKTGLLIKTAIIYILPFTLYFITSYFLRHSRIFLKSNFLEKY